jgi:hypothetical protein
VPIVRFTSRRPDGAGLGRVTGASPCRGGGQHSPGRVKRWHNRSTPGAAAVPILVSESGDTVETKRAAHRFSAIRMRSLSDRRQCALPTVQTVTLLSTPPRHLQAKTDASVTIRLLIPTPAQRVSRSRAETDVLQLSAAARRFWSDPAATNEHYNRASSYSAAQSLREVLKTRR